MDDWRDIWNWPGHEVNQDGIVRNKFTKRQISTSRAKDGSPKITITKPGGIRSSLTMRRVVAEAFTQGLTLPDEFDSIIQRDGDSTNVAADNLMWRPRWFAWRYKNQFKDIRDSWIEERLIVNQRTGEVFESIYNCGVVEGLLFKDIETSLITGRVVWPSNATYKYYDS